MKSSGHKRQPKPTGWRGFKPAARGNLTVSGFGCRGTTTRLLQDWPALHLSRLFGPHAQAKDFYPMPLVVLSVEDVKALLTNHEQASCMTTARYWDQEAHLSHQRHQRVQAWVWCIIAVLNFMFFGFASYGLVQRSSPFMPIRRPDGGSLTLLLRC